MKQGLILSVVASSMLFAGGDIAPIAPVVEVEAAPVAVDSFGQALKDGKFSADMRIFYFDRSFDEDLTGIPNTKALTGGGIFKYESGSYYGAKFGLAYYGSHRIGTFFSREEGKGTSILGRDGEDISFLGEAYLQYDIGNTMVKVGRQQLATPLIQNHDLRLLPSVYEAAIIRNTDISDTMVELGYVRRYSGFTSKDNGFFDYNTKWGEDGLGYISFTNKSAENLSIRGQYVKALSDTDNEGLTIAIDDYKYLDFKYDLDFGNNTYLKGQYGANSYSAEDDSRLLGAKLGTTLFDMVDVAVLYDKISGNAFKAIESGPMYSDWQQGYGNYDPSTAYGGQIIFRPMAGLSLKFGYVDVNADEGGVRDDFSEFNFDGKYTINDYSKIRVRYSIKDQTDTSDREDRNDFRIIYYISF